MVAFPGMVGQAKQFFDLMPLLDQHAKGDHDGGNIAIEIIEAVDIDASGKHRNQIVKDGHAQQGEYQVERQKPISADERLC